MNVLDDSSILCQLTIYYEIYYQVIITIFLYIIIQVKSQTKCIVYYCILKHTNQ